MRERASPQPADGGRFRRGLSAVGGPVAAAVVCLLLLATGGSDSIFQDLFVVILVHAAVAGSWWRLARETVVVAVAAAVPGLVEGVGLAFHLDLAADLVVWVAVAVLAGVLQRRVRRATSGAHRLRAAVDEVDDMITVVDADTLRISYLNRQAARQVGLEQGEAVGMRPWELTDGVTEQRVRALVDALEVGGPGVKVDHTSHRTDPPRVYETSSRLVPGDGGGAQLVSVARDVTEQRRAEAAARERAAMVEAADIAMIGTDLEGWVRSWNPAAERLYGVAAAAAVGKHVSDVVRGPSDDIIRGRAAFPVEQRFLRYSTRHHRLGATVFDAEVTAWPVTGSSGARPGVALLVRDVTQFRQAVRELRRREGRFRTLAEQASGVVYRVEFGPPQAVTFLGPRITELLGADRDDLLGRPLPLERVHPDDHTLFDPGRADHPRLSEGVTTYRLRHADGHWVWVEDHHRPEYDHHGCVVATQGILFDVTMRRELEEARSQALEHERELARQLERTAAAQETFLRSISHELRTPLTSVRGFAHTLRDHRTRLDEATTDRLLRRLVANVDRLDAQLADLLDLDLDPDRGGREHWDDVDLRALSLAAVATVRAPSHTVEVDVTPTTVRGDGVRLGRVVAALVHNAVRHTPSGTTVRLWQEVDDEATVLHVEDDGPGVDPGIRRSMFDPFVQGEVAGSSPSPGAGVGLALAREIATLHGGTVVHHDRRPRGTCFCLRLPHAH